MPENTILAADVGNTTICMGLFEDRKLVRLFRLESDPDVEVESYVVQIARQLAGIINLRERISGVVLGSVVPNLTAIVELALNRFSGRSTYIVTHDSKFPIQNKYEVPRAAGIDRLANAAGAVAIGGAPIISVDAGTAVTLDVVDRDASFLGGAIFPGAAASARVLHGRTAQLPSAEIKQPSHAIGRNTADAIRSGVIWGMAGAVDSLIDRTWAELGYETPLLATGGQGEMVAANSQHEIRLIPELTARGLVEIYLCNQA